MKLITLTLTFTLLASVAIAQRSSPPAKAELAQITERGRQLAQYDVAAWYATDAVVATRTVNYLMTMEEFRKKKGN
jgi:hypothetical protein